MFIRRKLAFYRLLGLIREVESNPRNLDAVRSINVEVLQEILHAEASIARHKTELSDLTERLKLGRGSREISVVLRRRLKRVEGYISARRDQIFIWKSFGDALAYLYLDKFSIKHAFFETESFGIKRDAGHISGKIGLAAEIACLMDALNHGVPAVLCDVTNTLRYGDVCLLGASDPYLIEVKSSERGNKRRRKRQADQLTSLHSFLDNDEAPGFRGAAGTTHRVSLETVERNHRDAIQACLTRAKDEGQSWVQPERGVTYVAIYGNFDPKKMPASVGEAALFYSLNADKNSHTWAPYVPFLLTLRASDHLVDFIEGRLSIFVLVDPTELCRLIAVEGWIARVRPGQDYLVETLHPQTGEFQSLSSQLVSRVAYEFVSLSWIAEIHGTRPTRLASAPNHTSEADAKAVMREMFIQKFGADDEWLPLLS